MSPPVSSAVVQSSKNGKNPMVQNQISFPLVSNLVKDVWAFKKKQ